MLPKPQLRGLLKSQLQRHFIAAASLMFVVTASFRVFYKNKHEEKYAEFYKFTSLIYISTLFFKCN